MSWLSKVLCAAVLAAQLGTAGSMIPAGTTVRVRLGQTISSDKARSGESWEGTLARNLVVHGKVIARRGAVVRGAVVTARSSGRLSRPGLLELQLRSIRMNGRNESVVSSTYRLEGQSHKGRNVKSAGGGAALGAIIGAVAGGGKGAAIGAGAGAAAGTAGAAVTGKKDVVVRVESLLTFRIR